jgi:hypothetical protein
VFGVGQLQNVRTLPALHDRRRGRRSSGRAAVLAAQTGSGHRQTGGTAHAGLVAGSGSVFVDRRKNGTRPTRQSLKRNGTLIERKAQCG